MNVRVMVLALAAALAGAGPVLAQAKMPAEPPSHASPGPARSAEAEKDRLTRESNDAFARQDYVAAETALRRLTAIDADNFVPWYNLACALSLQGRTQDAGPMLEKAIELGFADVHYMKADPHLANLRRTDNFKKLVSHWDEILSASIDDRLARARKLYGPGYTYEKDEAHRLAYVSAFPAESFDRAKHEINSLISWWESNVGSAAPAKGHDTDEVPWVLVILPTPQDYARWARARYGEGWERIGGTYSHDEKALVAKDLGATLRHEFWHVLHWRNMDVLGERHPVWIMEGLCSLMEDVKVEPDGSARPLPSWRTNQVGQLARVGKLTPWDVLFKLDQKQFVGSRPLAFYGQSRAVFMWLAEQGKLKEWYAAYTAGFKEDPTGLSAFAAVFAQPLRKTEADFRAWARRLPVVDEDFPVGSAVLPFDVDPMGAGDGLSVAQSDALEHFSGRSKGLYANAGGILPRDVILTIDDHPVHEMGELIRVLADHSAGDKVRVGYRRLKKTGVALVTLIEKR